MKYTLTFLIVLLLTPLTGTYAEDAAKPATRPNVVVILTFTLIAALLLAPLYAANNPQRIRK